MTTPRKEFEERSGLSALRQLHKNSTSACRCSKQVPAAAAWGAGRGKAKRLPADSVPRFGFRDVRVGFLRLLVQPLEFLFELLQLFVGKVFKIDKFITRAFEGPDQLVEFQLNGFPVAVLRVLDDKDHQEGDDSRASIDDELPSVGVVKLRSGCGPHDNHQDRKSEGPCCAQHNRGSARKGTKRVAHCA